MRVFTKSGFANNAILKVPVSTKTLDEELFIAKYFA